MQSLKSEVFNKLYSLESNISDLKDICNDINIRLKSYEDHNTR